MKRNAGRTGRPVAAMNSPRLQRELKKKRPFEQPEQEAILNIVRTSDLAQNRFGKVFRAFGVTASQYNVLRILRGAGKPLPSLEIADRMIQVVPALTGLIDRVDQQGLLERHPGADDRRLVAVALAARPEALLARMGDPVHVMVRTLLGHLSRRKQTELSRLLEKAAEGLETEEAEATLLFRVF